MAQFLIRGIDNHAVERGLREDQCFKRGDVVLVAPDDHTWGAKEGSPDFEVVRVSGNYGDFLDYTRRSKTGTSLWRFDFDVQVFVNKETMEIRRLT